VPTAIELRERVGDRRLERRGGAAGLFCVPARVGVQQDLRPDLDGHVVGPPEHRLDPRAEVVGGPAHGDRSRHPHLLADTAGEPFEQGGAIGEVPVHGGLGHASALGDLAGGDVVGPAILQQIGEGIEDQVAGALGLFSPQRGAVVAR
jgi:hypothetical protein